MLSLSKSYRFGQLNDANHSASDSASHANELDDRFPDYTSFDIKKYFGENLNKSIEKSSNSAPKYVDLSLSDALTPPKSYDDDGSDTDTTVELDPEIDFMQFSQKCTICGMYFFTGEALMDDPDNKLHKVHKSCADIITPTHTNRNAPTHTNRNTKREVSINTRNTHKMNTRVNKFAEIIRKKRIKSI